MPRKAAASNAANEECSFPMEASVSCRVPDTPASDDLRAGRPSGRGGPQLRTKRARVGRWVGLLLVIPSDSDLGAW
jgi:hypothetical protein